MKHYSLRKSNRVVFVGRMPGKGETEFDVRIERDGNVKRVRVITSCGDGEVEHVVAELSAIEWNAKKDEFELLLKTDKGEKRIGVGPVKGIKGKAHHLIDDGFAKTYERDDETSKEGREAHMVFLKETPKADLIKRMIHDAMKL